MNMGHLQASPSYAREFFSMEEILDRIASRYTFSRTDAPFDSTAVRYDIAGKGVFGVIANESEPFCRNCTGFVYRLTAPLRVFIQCAFVEYSRSLALPDDQAKAALHKVLLGPWQINKARIFRVRSL